MKTKRGQRLLSLLMSLAMALGLLPGLTLPASAADATVEGTYTPNVYFLPKDTALNKYTSADPMAVYIKSLTVTRYTGSAGSPAVLSENESITFNETAKYKSLGATALKSTEGEYYPLTITFELQDGVTFESLDLVVGATTGSALSLANPPTPTSSDNGKTYTVTVAPTADYRITTSGTTKNFRLVFRLNVPTTCDVTYYPIPGNTSATVKKTVTENSSLTAPTVDDYASKDEAYFTLMEVTDWYTEAPTANNDGSYTYDEEKKWDFTSGTVTADTALYAKTQLKTDAAVPAVISVPVYKKATNQYLTDGGSVQYVKKDGETLTLETEAVQVRLPVETAIPVGSIPGTGSYSALFSNWSSCSYTACNGTVTNWYYRNADSEVVKIKDGNKIPFDVAYAALSARKNQYLSIKPTVNFTFTAAFNTNIDGKSIESFSAQVQHQDSVQAPMLTEAKVAELEIFVDTVEADTSVNKFFRGWYPNESFTDGTKVDLTASTYIYGPVDFYAKWVDKCTITYNMNGQTCSNESAFLAAASTIVGAGDLLTEPVTRPVSASGAAFEGWYTDSGCSTAFDFSNTAITTNTTLYAKWNTSAAKTTMEFQYYRPDDMSTRVTLSTVVVPFVSNYKFGTESLPALPGDSETHVATGEMRDLTYTEWKFYDKDGVSQPLTADTVLATHFEPAPEKITVTAETKTSYTVTFDAMGGTFDTGAQTKQTITEEQSWKASAPAVSWSGKDLQGWFTDLSDTTETAFDFNNQAISKHTNFYAKWSGDIIYKVMFDMSSTTGATLTLKDAGGQVITPASTENNIITYYLTRATYTYSITAAGYVAVNDTLLIHENSEMEQTIPVTLKEFVSVTSINMSLQEAMQGQSYDLNNLSVIEPSNATVKGISWAANGDLPSGVTLTGSTLTVGSTTDVNSSISLTATVSGGKLANDGTQHEDYTKSFNISVAAYRPTITFANGSGDGPEISDIQSMPQPTTVNENKTLTKPADPSAGGWTFRGWYNEAACTNAWVESDTFTTDTTLYAKWEKVTVPVTITFAGGTDAVANTGVSNSITGNSGDKVTLPAPMFSKDGYIFKNWGGYLAAAQYILPNASTTLSANWTAIGSSNTATDVENSLAGIGTTNAGSYQPQIEAAVEALAQVASDEEQTQTNLDLIADVEALYEAAFTTPKVSITGDASTGASEVGAILSSDGTKSVELQIKNTTAGKSIPSEYQDGGYVFAYRTISMLVGGSTQSKPTIPITITLPIPSELDGMATDTIRVLHYKGTSTTPTVLIPVISGENMTFVMDSFSHVYIVGKAISEQADTSVTDVVMKYNGTAMGKVTQDDSGNFTITLPATTSESITGDLSSGIGNKWVTYITAAAGCKIQEKGTGGIAEQTADYWKNTGVCVTYTIDSANSWTATRTFTVTAADGATTRDFTITVKKITSEDQIYEIATSNIVGGTVTASPNPAAAGEDVKLTITPNQGMKLSPGSLSWNLQTAGAANNTIDETTLTFTMPAGDININATFVSDGSGTSAASPQITSFMINGVSAAINNETRVITIVLPYGTDLSTVAPVINGVNIKSISPASAQRVNLRSAKTYTVYGTDGTSVTYTVAAYTEDPTPAMQLWESLQDHIDSTDNWWELAEYQKITGYYDNNTSGQTLYSLQTYLDDITAQYGTKRTTLTNYYNAGRLMLEPASYSMAGTSYSNTLDIPRKTLSNLADLGYSIVTYNLRELQIDIYEKMETTKGLELTVSAPSSTIRSTWNKLSGSGRIFEIEASSTKAGLVLRIPVGDVLKSELSLMKYDPTKAKFVEVDRDTWYIQNGYLITSSVSAGIYGLRDI